jgi:hypothetical protein
MSSWLNPQMLVILVLLFAMIGWCLYRFSRRAVSVTAFRDTYAQLDRVAKTAQGKFMAKGLGGQTSVSFRATGTQNGRLNEESHTQNVPA